MGVGGLQNYEEKTPKFLARNGTRAIQIEVLTSTTVHSQFFVLFSTQKEPENEFFVLFSTQKEPEND
jgi:hypothetical protein